MSQFLPETGGAGNLTGATQTGLALTERDRADMLRLFGRPQLIPNAFWAYLVDYISVNQPQIPISQIFGFAQFTAQAATAISTAESTNSATYTDLATVGPTLTLLPDGKYIVVFGSTLRSSSSAFEARMGVKINSTEATDAGAILTLSGSYVPGARVVTTTLANSGNNTITARYRSNDVANDVFFQNRWLVAFRYANT